MTLLWKLCTSLKASVGNEDIMYSFYCHTIDNNDHKIAHTASLAEITERNGYYYFICTGLCTDNSK